MRTRAPPTTKKADPPTPNFFLCLMHPSVQLLQLHMCLRSRTIYKAAHLLKDGPCRRGHQRLAGQPHAEAAKVAGQAVGLICTIAGRETGQKSVSKPWPRPGDGPSRRRTRPTASHVCTNDAEAAVRSICATVFTTSNGWVNVVDSVALTTPARGAAHETWEARVVSSSGSSGRRPWTRHVPAAKFCAMGGPRTAGRSDAPQGRATLVRCRSAPPTRRAGRQTHQCTRGSARRIRHRGRPRARPGTPWGGRRGRAPWARLRCGQYARAPGPCCGTQTFPPNVGCRRNHSKPGGRPSRQSSVPPPIGAARSPCYLKARLDQRDGAHDGARGRARQRASHQVLRVQRRRRRLRPRRGAQEALQAAQQREVERRAGDGAVHGRHGPAPERLDALGADEAARQRKPRPVRGPAAVHCTTCTPSAGGHWPWTYTFGGRTVGPASVGAAAAVS